MSETATVLEISEILAPHKEETTRLIEGKENRVKDIVGLVKNLAFDPELTEALWIRDAEIALAFGVFRNDENSPIVTFKGTETGAVITFIKRTSEGVEDESVSKKINRLDSPEKLARTLENITKIFGKREYYQSLTADGMKATAIAELTKLLG